MLEEFFSAGLLAPAWIIFEWDGGGYKLLEGYLLTNGPVLIFDTYSELEPLKPFLAFAIYVWLTGGGICLLPLRAWSDERLFI